VVKYLIDKGIPEIRVKSMGYGFSKPVADNSTEEGRANNRRTEFKILEKQN
jgi:outer membrane protein OmpA-like peptidoglycan-associated protein